MSSVMPDGSGSIVGAAAVGFTDAAQASVSALGIPGVSLNPFSWLKNWLNNFFASVFNTYFYGLCSLVGFGTLVWGVYVFTTGSPPKGGRQFNRDSFSRNESKSDKSAAEFEDKKADKKAAHKAERKTVEKAAVVAA